MAKTIEQGDYYGQNCFNCDYGSWDRYDIPCSFCVAFSHYKGKVVNKDGNIHKETAEERGKEHDSC